MKSGSLEKRFNRRPCISSLDTLHCCPSNDQDMDSLASQVLIIASTSPKPKAGELVGKAERLKTFDQWSDDNAQTPDDLADAGFYFEGYADCVRCFNCSGRTRGWERDDNPWVEHARWFPFCSFVVDHKGKSFIDVVQELQKTNIKIHKTETL